MPVYPIDHDKAPIWDSCDVKDVVGLNVKRLDCRDRRDETAVPSEDSDGVLRLTVDPPGLHVADHNRHYGDSSNALMIRRSGGTGIVWCM